MFYVQGDCQKEGHAILGSIIHLICDFMHYNNIQQYTHCNAQVGVYNPDPKPTGFTYFVTPTPSMLLLQVLCLLSLSARKLSYHSWIHYF